MLDSATIMQELPSLVSQLYLSFYLLIFSISFLIKIFCESITDWESGLLVLEGFLVTHVKYASFLYVVSHVVGKVPNLEPY